MDSSVSPEDEIWFLRVCHHISTGFYRYGIKQDTTFTDGVIVEALFALLTAIPIKVVLALAFTFTVT